MKKIVYLFLLMFTVFFSYAQQEKIENIGQYFDSNFKPSPFLHTTIKILTTISSHLLEIGFIKTGIKPLF